MTRTSLDDDDDDAPASLPTITEEDGESVRSGSTSKSKDAKNGIAGRGASPTSEDSADSSQQKSRAEAAAAGAAHAAKKEKRRKKKDREKARAAAAFYASDDGAGDVAAQQILVDLCTEMRDLRASMQEGHDATSAAVTQNLESNQRVMQGLADKMDALQGNLAEVDRTIESKATPEQIEELARIRAVQEMMRAVTDDKERTVGVYEAHARRGYEEIERLRQDLAAERKEVASLRAELDVVRGDRQRMMAAGGGGIPMGHVGGGDGGSLADSHTTGASSRGPANPGAMYVNGGHGRGRGSGLGGDFDDMTLETKGSYDTAAYEMKSLKKRIIHMKKKLTVAQMEAKEAGELREEVERLRVELEREKKASNDKDERIKRMETEIELLKRVKANAAPAVAPAVRAATKMAPAPAPATTAGVSGSASRPTTTAPSRPAPRPAQPSRPAPPPPQQKQTKKFSSRTVVTKKKHWWENF
ncbi:hypothetical protein ACHAWF_009368 [Thalassiosira exigua]